ncbi:MAG: hypothetical protein SGCHY_003403, partial [Lobulomycetales sp.]
MELKVQVQVKSIICNSKVSKEKAVLAPAQAWLPIRFQELYRITPERQLSTMHHILFFKYPKQQL